MVSRLGENVWHAVDFRILAATNRDLRPLIDAGLFGSDLYERLAIVSIARPAASRAPGRSAGACEAFHGAVRAGAGANARHRDSSRCAGRLKAYPWPGNIRELRNAIYETLVYKRAGHQILPSDLPRRLLIKAPDPTHQWALDRAAIAGKISRGAMNLKEEVQTLERLAIDEALRRAGGNTAEAARLLGQVGRGMAQDPGGTLRAMMRRLGPRLR